MLRAASATGEMRVVEAYERELRERLSAIVRVSTTLMRVLSLA
jgi:hypothetical protein